MRAGKVKNKQMNSILSNLIQLRLYVSMVLLLAIICQDTAIHPESIYTSQEEVGVEGKLMNLLWRIVIKDQSSKREAQNLIHKPFEKI
jgi:hypothetical protein